MNKQTARPQDAICCCHWSPGCTCHSKQSDGLSPYWFWLQVVLCPSAVHIDKLLIYIEKTTLTFLLDLFPPHAATALSQMWCCSKNVLWQVIVRDTQHNTLISIFRHFRCWITAWCRLKLASFSCWFLPINLQSKSLIFSSEGAAKSRTLTWRCDGGNFRKSAASTKRWLRGKREN